MKGVVVGHALCAQVDKLDGGVGESIARMRYGGIAPLGPRGVGGAEVFAVLGAVVGGVEGQVVVQNLLCGNGAAARFFCGCASGDRNVHVHGLDGHAVIAVQNDVEGAQLLRKVAQR